MPWSHVKSRSRTFMRSLISQPSVSLLLFDEPSASLDPTAEHGNFDFLTFLFQSLINFTLADLFERLRLLRGNKTMIFSSHRFGNLTRHADLILYENFLPDLGSVTWLWHCQVYAWFRCGRGRNSRILTEKGWEICPPMEIASTNILTLTFLWNI